MFTGLIETTGILKNRQINEKDGIIQILSKKSFKNLLFGESIAVNGACLTLSQLPDNESNLLSFNVLAESFKKTNLGSIELGSKVNLERALEVGARLGGHIVQGHVDTVGKVYEWENVGRDKILKINYPENLSSFLVKKGSITLDGVSLTIVELTDTFFSVHLIPTTLNETCLGEKKPGSLINIETDIIGKYVNRFMSSQTNTGTNITMESLLNAGW